MFPGWCFVHLFPIFSRFRVLLTAFLFAGCLSGDFHLVMRKLPVIRTPPFCLESSHIVLTSSTAQGGGGSFKNRKPIGEIGCCESGMAERIHCWTERCLRSPLFLSLSLTIYLPTYLFSMYLSIYLSIDLSIYLSIWLSVVQCHSV